MTGLLDRGENHPRDDHPQLRRTGYRPPTGGPPAVPGRPGGRPPGPPEPPGPPQPPEPPRHRRHEWRPRRPSRNAVWYTLTGLGAAILVLPDLLLLDGIPPFTQLVAFRPAITAVVAACAIGLLVWRPSRRFGAVVGVLSLIAVGMTLPRGLPPISSNNQLAAGRTLSVLSLNVQEGQADLGTVGAILAERHPDVVVLPEAGRNYLRSLAPVLAQLGYRSTSVQSTPADVDGVSVLWSSDTGAVIATPTRDLVLPDIELTGGVLGKIRIVGLHTQAPTPGKFAGWSADLDTLPRWCQADGAVILAGDFNATLDHHQLRSGMDGCEDAGSAAGDGLTATWPSSSPRWLGAQIDHVLTRGQIAVSTFDVIDVPRTDHRAIMATLVLPRDQSG